MTTINQLSAQSDVQPSDAVPVYSQANAVTRRVTMAQVKEFVQDGLILEGGILALSSFYVMRGTSASAIALTTTPAPFNATQYSSPSFSLPASGSSLTFDAANGRLVATRDIQAVSFTASISGTWPTNRDLTLAVQVGDPLNLFTSAFANISAGGGANPRTVEISGPVSNLNDTQGIIRAGQIIRLVASFNTADTLNLTRIAFAVQTLDGM